MPNNIITIQYDLYCDVNYEAAYDESCKNGLILSTGQWYAPSAVINDAWFRMVLHNIAWYCIVLHGIAWYCIELHYIAWYCMVLHGIAWYYMVLHGITWYCRDIAVVAQKVKVVNEDRCDLKKWDH